MYSKWRSMSPNWPVMFYDSTCHAINLHAMWYVRPSMPKVVHNMSKSYMPCNIMTCHAIIWHGMYDFALLMSKSPRSDGRGAITVASLWPVMPQWWVRSGKASLWTITEASLGHHCRAWASLATVMDYQKQKLAWIFTRILFFLN